MHTYPRRLSSRPASKHREDPRVSNLVAAFAASQRLRPFQFIVSLPVGEIRFALVAAYLALYYSRTLHTPLYLTGGQYHMNYIYFRN